MTPDVVIYRYLQIVTSDECDVDELCLLLSTDADLLTRWLKLFNAPAQLSELRQQISTLTSAELNILAQAQAWSVLPIVGSARLNIDQWLAVLRAACLAQVLYEHLSTDQAAQPSAGEEQASTNIRLRALLAISGVDLRQDAQLSRLIEFRGSSPELLEDALIELRIFAVVDAVEQGQDIEMAQRLLGLAADVFLSLSQDADLRANALAQELGIDLSGEGDWAHRIWLKQQMSIATASLKEAQTLDALLEAHTIASRSFFETPPLILFQPSEDAPLELLGSDEYAIQLDSQSSLIPQAIREHSSTKISQAQNIAVVDRLLLRQLSTPSALALPMSASPQSALLAPIDEDTDDNLAVELYAQAISRHLQRILNTAPESQTDEKLEQFKTREYNRLREIVHEANNPLSIVHNYLHILELRLQHEPEAVEQLQLVAAELRRAGEVFTRARDIPSEVEEELNVTGELVELDAITWTQRLAEVTSGSAASAGVALRTSLAGESVVFTTQADKLTQILSNLLKNAIEACAPSDEVILGVRCNVYRAGQYGLEFFVEDSGPGLPTEVLSNLSGQKESHKGGDHQGIGLQIAFKLAIELSGALDVRTEEGKGTMFSLFLPITE